MPEFANPFSGKVPDRKLTKGELLRALRLDIAAEEEAVHLYMAHAEATDDPLAKKVLIDVADEERVHVGEFQRLIEILTAGEETQLLAQGAGEVDEMAGGLRTTGEPSITGASPAGGEQTTIGSLKDN